MATIIFTVDVITLVTTVIAALLIIIAAIIITIITTVVVAIVSAQPTPYSPIIGAWRTACRRHISAQRTTCRFNISAWCTACRCLINTLRTPCCHIARLTMAHFKMGKEISTSCWISACSALASICHPPQRRVQLLHTWLVDWSQAIGSRVVAYIGRTQDPATQKRCGGYTLSVIRAISLAKIFGPPQHWPGV
ncbi:hypothetical protein BGZ92_007117, partial [Podila epicladia]